MLCFLPMGLRSPQLPSQQFPRWLGAFFFLRIIAETVCQDSFREFAALNFPVVSQEVGGTNDRRNHRAFANDHRAFAENY